MENETLELTKNAKRDYSRLGLALFVLGIVGIAAQFLCGILWGILKNIGSPIADASWMMWVMTFAPLYLVAMPIGLLLMRRVPAEKRPDCKMGGKHFWLAMLICFPLMYGGNIIGTILSLLFSGGTAQNGLLDYVNDSPIYTILVMVILAPLLEEYIFRKQLIDRCAKYGEKTAVFLSAITFGLFHMNLFQLFYAFALGLIFAYVYTRTRRLRYSVIMHMIVNFLGSVVAPWVLTQVDMELMTEMSMGNVDPEVLAGALPGLILYFGYAFLLLGVSITGLILLIVNWKKSWFAPGSQQLPKGTAFKAAYLNVGMILFVILCLVMFVLNLL